MKICFVTHKVKKGDGQGRVNYEVITEALRQGHEIIVISSELSEDLRSDPRVEWVQIHVRRVPTFLLRYQAFAIWSAISLWIRRSRIDLVVVNGFITYAGSDINCIHFVHSAWVKSKYHPFRERKTIHSLYQLVYNSLNAFLERIFLRRTRHIIAVSEQVKQELVQDAGIAADRITVVPNGVDLNEFYPRSVNRADFQLEENRIYALFAGDLKSKRKNLDTVLKALAEVPDIHLLVLGDVDKSPYPKLAEQLGLNERVVFLGYRKDIADIMSLSDLFIFPSRYEPFSLVILEAMATGLPVITSSRCGVVELLSEDAAVVMDDPEDTQALVSALRELVNNHERIQLMAQKAREDAGRNSWGRMSIQYLSLFQETSRVKFHTSKQTWRDRIKWRSQI